MGKNGDFMKYALVILCGGNSSHMGTDKALLPFGDTCLLEYLVTKFQPYFSTIYLSVKRKGDYVHLSLPVTEIANIYPNAGPMSGIFSGLSMMDEDAAFFMSMDTPFLEPEIGIALLDHLNDADICAIEGEEAYPDTSTGAYSKNCITTIGKCLLLHRLTFEGLKEQVTTAYLSKEDLLSCTDTPLDAQFFHMQTRKDYYQALKRLNLI